MYTLDQYGSMISDELRFPPYAEAIKKAVRAGDAVLDLGSGPGVFALLACRAGARRVFAVDIDGVVDFGRQLASANGYSDRIEFMRGDSRQLHLPEKVNVIVADLRGALPFLGQALPSLEDARKRFLADGGRMIPQRDFMCAGIVDASEQYQNLVKPWNNGDGLDLKASLPIILNGIYRKHLKAQNLISAPHRWCCIEYTSGASMRGAGVATFTVNRNAMGHGVGLWFDTELMDGIGFSTIPRETESVYGHGFLPWLEPVSLSEGDEVHVELHADPVGTDYVWRWDTSIPARGGRQAKHFQQSTFFGAHFSPSSLRKRSADFVPVLSEAGQAERWILQAIDGHTPLQEIAIQAASRFPHVFNRVEDAFTKAGELADKLAR